MEFDEWLKIGRENKWISKPVCETHDGLPMTKEELDVWDEGGDPCIHALRLYENVSDFLNAEGEANV
jgi:hypothetical protein